MNRTIAKLLLMCAAVVLCWPAGAAAQSDTGFSPIFDGKSLDGWKAADMSYWSVQDGAITGTISAEHPLKENLYLIWQGGELADFELKLKSRITNSSNTNNGFQFRSKELPNHDVAGYQVDNQQGSSFLVRLYDEHGRHDLALRGQRTTIDANGKAVVDKIEAAAGAVDFKLEDWHEYHLICVGTRLTLQVNGKLMAEVIDNDPKNLDLQGILGLQLHSGGPVTVQFRDIRLKILKAASAEAVPQPKAEPQPKAQSQSANSPDLPALADKTLVVWAAPANLTQQPAYRGRDRMPCDPRAAGISLFDDADDWAPTASSLAKVWANWSRDARSGRVTVNRGWPAAFSSTQARNPPCRLATSSSGGSAAGCCDTSSSKNLNAAPNSSPPAAATRSRCASLSWSADAAAVRCTVSSRGASGRAPSSTSRRFFSSCMPLTRST